jgi:hypothetical protein
MSFRVFPAFAYESEQGRRWPAAIRGARRECASQLRAAARFFAADFTALMISG